MSSKLAGVGVVSIPPSLSVSKLAGVVMRFHKIIIDFTRVDNSRRAFDVENLVSDYRPSYQNQVLKDLFSHYMDAWKTWYNEFTQKNPLPNTSQHQ